MTFEKRGDGRRELRKAAGEGKRERGMQLPQKHWGGCRPLETGQDGIAGEEMDQKSAETV
jgi:hypothetical protein